MEGNAVKSNNTGRWIQGTLLGLCAFALMAQGCTKLSQDPFSGQSDDVKNPQIPHEKVSPTPIVIDSSGILQIDHDDFYTFQEGKAGAFKLAGRVLVAVDGHEAVAGTDYVLSVDNLGDFKGATFNGTTGDFAWTPPLDYVDTAYNKQATMEVTIKMLKGFSYTRSGTVKIFVERQLSDPVVQSVDGLSNAPIHENDRKSFTITVRDPDSDPTHLPSLVITNVQSGANLASLVTVTGVPTRDASDPAKWIFNATLDATGAELTASESTLYFAVMSVSAYGHASSPFKVSVKVRTLAANPSVGWSQNFIVPFTGGLDNLYTFSVMDPKSEGKIRVVFNSCGGFGSSATCTCAQDQFYTYLANCQIKWKPGTFSGGDYTINGYAYNDSPIAGDTAGSTFFSRTIRVTNSTSAPTPTPNPFPTPTPKPTPF
jgi:hypothetical protein